MSLLSSVTSLIPLPGVEAVGSLVTSVADAIKNRKTQADYDAERKAVQDERNRSAMVNSAQSSLSEARKALQDWESLSDQAKIARVEADRAKLSSSVSGQKWATISVADAVRAYSKSLREAVVVAEQNLARAQASVSNPSLSSSSSLVPGGPSYPWAEQAGDILGKITEPMRRPANDVYFFIAAVVAALIIFRK